VKRNEEINKSQNISEILNDAMINLKKAIDIHTIVGDPYVCEDGTTMVPVSKVYVGIVSGGGEVNSSKKTSNSLSYPFAGASGSGFTVVPMGFLVSSKGNTTFISTETDKSSEKLIELTNRTLKILLSNLKKDKWWEILKKF